MPVALAVIIFAIRVEFLRSTAIKIEMRFIGNLNERYLKSQKESRGDNRTWLDEKMWLISFEIREKPEHNRVVEFGNNRCYHVTIVKIIRNGKGIVMPGPEERIVNGDILHVLGTRAEIDVCILMLKNTNSTNAPDAGPWKLKEYLHLQVLKKTAPEEQLICVPLKVDRRSILYKKPIKYS